jgi:hypothetical protein
MPERERPDYLSRTPEALAEQFDYFGEVECPQLDAHFYRALCRDIQNDTQLLAMAAHASPTQPPVNLLFGAVHYLLLGGASHALRDWYPALATAEPRSIDSAFPVFRDFCLAHRAEIVRLIETRLTQTNVVQRCSALLPAFARVFEEGDGAPLALIEIGPSAGLNMQWDRFRYRYGADGKGGGRSWGDARSPVVVECALRGDVDLPPLPSEIPVVWRRGIDLHPIDIGAADPVRWLRALVWPDHPGRQERLSAAIEIARQHRPAIIAGDASRELPKLIEQVPTRATLCIYGTHTLYQFPRDALIATLRAMQASSRSRPIRFVSVEGTGDRCSELKVTLYQGGERTTTLAARCNPHGRWLEWLA